MALTISDISGERAVEVATVEGEGALRRWLAAAATAEPTFYGVDVPDDGTELEFALGRGVAGALVIADDGAHWMLVGGDPAQPEVAMSCRGFASTIEGSALVGAERLVAAIAHHVTTGEKIAGSWVRDDNESCEPVEIE